MPYLTRSAEKEITLLSEQFPAVATFGPRQVGKTSLAKHLASLWEQKSVYLDLENPANLNKLSDPALFLGPLQGQTVILDEVQRVPHLFPVLHGLIDAHRVPRRFIFLGSASPDFIRDASETLAGRIAYFEMPPMTFSEVAHLTDYRTHWLRGGFPDSLLAGSESASGKWRDAFIQTYLERDRPMLGLSANPVLTRRLWTMLAYLNGNLLNLDSHGNSLGSSSPTVKRYLDFFEASYMIRRLQPWYVNISKRLLKSPKVYLRDTGILHALLAIDSYEQLLGHPVVGTSWEAYILQELASMLPPRHEMYFYRTHDGTEADIVIVKAGIPEILVEIKHHSAPTITKGMLIAAADLKTRRNVIVAPVEDNYPLRDGFEVVSHQKLARLFD